MNKLSARFVITLTALLAAPFAILAQSNTLPLRSDYWSDPEFIKKFTASYGFNSATDPSITSEEKEIFDALVPLIRSDINAAISTLAATLTPESSAALDFTLGNLYFESGNFDAAVRQYKIALKKFPNFMRAHSLLGKVYVRTGKISEAIPSFIKTIELGGADGDIFGLLGYCYLNQEKVSSALSAYETALLYSPDSNDWKLGKAQCLLILQKWDDAVGLFGELLLESPDKADYWLLQANAYLGLGNISEAAANYEVLRRMGKARPDSLFQLGDIYINEGLRHLAYPVYIEALKADPAQDERRPLQVAQILTGQGDWDRASSYTASIRKTFGDKLSEEGEMKLLTLESQIALATGNEEKAVSTLRQIIDRDPLNGEALLQLAGYLADKDRAEEAIFNFEAARELEDYKLRALLEEAQLYVRLSEYSKAIPLLREAQRIDPQDRIAKYLEAVEQAELSSRL